MEILAVSIMSIVLYISFRAIFLVYAHKRMNQYIDDAFEIVKDLE